MKTNTENKQVDYESEARFWQKELAVAERNVHEIRSKLRGLIELADEISHKDAMERWMNYGG